MGADESRARGSLRFSFGRTATQADVDALADGDRRGGRAGQRPPPRVADARWPSAAAAESDRCACSPRCQAASTRPSPRPGRPRPGTRWPACTWRCRANPSSYRTGARGCCTLEDARDARRAADVIGIPFYVWDLAERFAADVVDDFVAEYAAGNTPNPCLRCNEKIKFAAVLDRAVALGFDAVCTGHHARLDPPRPTAGPVPGPQRRPGQGPVLRPRPCSRPAQLPARMFPLGDSTKEQVRAEAAGAGSRSPTSRTATTSASSPTATPGASCAAGSARRRARSWIPTARSSGSHEGSYGFTVGQRRGLRIGEPARATAGRGTCSASSRSPAPSGSGPAEAAGRRRDHRGQAGLDRAGEPPAGPVEARGPAARARRDVPGDLLAGRAIAADQAASGPPGAWPGARPPCCTTATPSSARPRSPRPPPPQPPPPRRPTPTHLDPHPPHPPHLDPPHLDPTPPPPPNTRLGPRSRGVVRASVRLRPVRG